VLSKEYRECRNVIDCFLNSNNIADKGARRDRNSLIGQYIWSGKQLLSSSISLDEFRVKSSLFYQSRRVVGEYAIIAIKWWPRGIFLKLRAVNVFWWYFSNAGCGVRGLISVSFAALERISRCQIFSRFELISSCPIYSKKDLGSKTKKSHKKSR